MTEYTEVVERQKLLLDAEEWAKGIEQIHCHKTNTCYYDYRPQDTENGSVTDITYNDGRIEREKDGKLIHTFGKKLEGDALIQKYLKMGA